MSEHTLQKYHGLGNDFLLVRRGALPEEPEAVRRVCARHEGVGADGVLFWEEEADGVRMILYNDDGSRPEMCGNGVRCLVAMLVDLGHLEARSEVVVLSDAGPRPCTVRPGEAPGVHQVRVGMGRAVIPDARRTCTVDGRTYTFTDVDMGNPHAVILEAPEDVTLEHVDRVGRWANEATDVFEAGVNVEFVSEAPDGALDVVVYERGVGRTQACGTGACAVAAAAWRAGLKPAGARVRVRLPGGVLEVEEGEGGAVVMTGPAVRVFGLTLDERWMARMLAR
ncbi:MAG: diaminopimelate epimerase [Myxococcota bacterium]